MLDKITVDNLSDLFKTTLSYKKNNDLEFFVIRLDIVVKEYFKLFM